ncbi:MAG: Lrp/AsnC family transcriptional regulator [Candidatus Rokubacteria bacterium]|nr:Lrp/AsnC family transcriptional regulator [Candidatus Rokubacteria bacterium]
MATRAERLLDETGWRILDALQDNARIPFSELGRQVGRSAPAVGERVRRMEEAGLITGYRVELGLEKLGFPIVAVIRVAAPEEKCPRLKTLADGLAEVLECHHVTGADAFVLKVIARSVKHLESVIEAIARHGGTPATAVVLSSPVDRTAVSVARRATNGATRK